MIIMWWLILFLGLIGNTGLSSAEKERRLRARASSIYVDKCPNPCTCPSPATEICDECQECPRQLGEPCDEENPCDLQHGLICKYLHGDSEGVCRESSGVPCVVYNKTYEHGETFSLDCRTQCACQNGTYGCSSLCPQEHISPKGTCRHPRLVEIPGQCCREWMCDSQTEQPPSCQPAFTKWSTCGSDCGAGLSTRRSNLNSKCEPATETRICQIRRCDELTPTMYKKSKEHHLRKGHECKATHRISTPVTLRFGPCRSRKKFRPKYCGKCPIPGIDCSPLLSTTVKVDFLCDSPSASEDSNELLPEYIEPGEDLWNYDPIPNIEPETRIMSVSVQWILKCRCEQTPPVPTSSSGEVILHRVHRTAAP